MEILISLKHLLIRQRSLATSVLFKYKKLKNNADQCKLVFEDAMKLIFAIFLLFAISGWLCSICDYDFNRHFGKLSFTVSVQCAPKQKPCEFWPLCIIGSQWDESTCSCIPTCVQKEPCLKHYKWDPAQCNCITNKA